MKKIILFNLNFDDFHPQTDRDGDFGGDLDDGNFKYIKAIWEEFPELKITMFTTPNWIDTPYRLHHYFYHLRRILRFKEIVPSLKNEPFRLDKHPECCNKIRELINENKIEIAIHGYYHYNPKLVIHGQEFQNLSYEESKKRILLAEEILQKVNLPFVKIFRPPGWGISEGLLKALKELNYQAIAVHSSSSRTYEIGEYYGLKTIHQNYSISEKPEIALEQAEKRGVVLAKGHMCYNYGKEIIENGLCEKNYMNLRDALYLLNQKFEIKFIFLSDLLNTRND
jgi:peptidoglycan/xylan/chitin deacetylase (PgdA/CDA1 family)